MSTYTFKMPDIGEGVVEAEITAWHVKLGDTVNEDDPIADAMTDKATIELTAPVDGVVQTLGCEEGDKIAVGAGLVVFETEGDVEEEDEHSESPASEPGPPEVQEKTTPAGLGGPASRAGTSKRDTQDKVLASPRVRALAKERNLDLSTLTGTGPKGRITEFDLDGPRQASAPKSSATLPLPAPVEGETRTKVIGMRRMIAQAMQDSKRNIPHFTYVEEIDVTELEALRQRANQNRLEDRPKLSVLPFIIRALCLAIEKWPQFNSRYYDDHGQLITYADIDLGIAAQTDQGLVVPVLRGAQSLTLWNMAGEINRLAEGARDQKLSREELTGATTTLTSLGPLGGIVTTPVINRPEVAIFGPNKIREKLVLEDGHVIARKVMNFSISCDHRIIDGYDAAEMVQYVKALIEDPTTLFL